MTEEHITAIGVIIIFIAIAVIYIKMWLIWRDVEIKKFERIKREFMYVEDFLKIHGLKADTYEEAMKLIKKYKLK